ncbi:MAG: hypothetical protein ACLP1X_24380 [Polyangiaceae bacterium]
MLRRDPVNEVLEVKSRAGRRPSSFLDDLTRLWQTRREQFVSEQLVSVTDFFPIRIVTLVEVFTQRWEKDRPL